MTAVTVCHGSESSYFKVPANALANRNIGQETTTRTTTKATSSGKKSG